MKKIIPLLLILVCFGIAADKDVSKERKSVVKKAESFIGTKYKYGSCEAKAGFDCTGLVYNVFGTMDIYPPRSSKNYVDLKQIDLYEAKVGDVIVFNGYQKGTDTPGHVGIISKIKSNNVYFIHSSSSRGVIESDLHQKYYIDRYLFVVNLLDD